MAEEYTYRIEKEIEVMAYLQDLRYALDHGAEITFQEKRKVDKNKLLCQCCNCCKSVLSEIT